MKKTKPTPKSITHKNPIKISPSSNNNQIPKTIKYIPAKYQSVNMLYVLTKNKRVVKDNIWRINISLNTKYTQSDYFCIKTYVYKVVSKNSLLV